MGMGVGSLLGGFVRMVGGMQMVRMRQVSVMRSSFMLMRFGMLGSLVVMMSSVLMMHGGVRMMFVSGVSHDVPRCLNDCLLQPLQSAPEYVTIATMPK